MTKFPTSDELSHEVYVTASVMAQWDGKEYDLNKPTKLAYGIVYHWEQTMPGIEFKIDTVPAAEIAARTVVNPLEENDRGEAFAGLRRGRKPKETE